MHGKPSHILQGLLGSPWIGRVNFKHKRSISGVEMSVTSSLKLLETQLEVVINTN